MKNIYRLINNVQFIALLNLLNLTGKNLINKIIFKSAVQILPYVSRYLVMNCLR